MWTPLLLDLEVGFNVGKGKILIRREADLYSFNADPRPPAKKNPRHDLER
jgi:hypothetical protein